MWISAKLNEKGLGGLRGNRTHEGLRKDLAQIGLATSLCTWPIAPTSWIASLPQLLAEVMGTSHLAWHLFSSRAFIILGCIPGGLLPLPMRRLLPSAARSSAYHPVPCIQRASRKPCYIPVAKLDSADSHFRTDPGRLPRVDYTPRNFPGMVAES